MRPRARENAVSRVASPGRSASASALPRHRPMDEIPPPSDGMPPSDSGVGPPMDEMPPPRDGMPPSDTGVGPPMDEMPPPSDGMPPSDSGVGPPMDEMPPPSDGMPRRTAASGRRWTRCPAEGADPTADRRHAGGRRARGGIADRDSDRDAVAAHRADDLIARRNRTGGIRGEPLQWLPQCRGRRQDAPDQARRAHRQAILIEQIDAERCRSGSHRQKRAVRSQRQLGAGQPLVAEAAEPALPRPACRREQHDLVPGQVLGRGAPAGAGREPAVQRAPDHQLEAVARARPENAAGAQLERAILRDDLLLAEAQA